MPKRIPPVEERALCQRLRQEALDDRPDFSETLHHRILAAVQECGRQETLVHGGADILACPRDLGTEGRQECLPPVGKRHWPAYVTAALTAACLFVAVVAGWRMAVHQNAGPLVAETPGAATGTALPPIEELAGNTIESLNDLVASAAIVPQSDDLEEGVLLAADALLHPLPVDVDLAVWP
jgi:hypothetical protein